MSEEENKAAEMVEKRFTNCEAYRETCHSEYCNSCGQFIPSRTAIDAKIEELREQTVGKQNLNSKVEESKKSIWRSPEEKPVKGNFVLVLNKYGTIDWTDCSPEDLSGTKGFMYFSDLRKVLKAFPQLEVEREEMVEVLKYAREYMSDDNEFNCSDYYTDECPDDCSICAIKKQREKIDEFLKKVEGK